MNAILTLSSAFLCRIVKSLNFVWVLNRPKQPEGEGKEEKGGHSEDTFQNSDDDDDDDVYYDDVDLDDDDVDEDHLEEVSVCKR